MRANASQFIIDTRTRQVVLIVRQQAAQDKLNH